MNDSSLKMEQPLVVETDEHAEITNCYWFLVHMNLKMEALSTAKALHVKLAEHPVSDEVVLFQIAGATSATQKELLAWVSASMKTNFEMRRAERVPVGTNREILPFPDGEKPASPPKAKPRQQLA